MGGGGCMRGIRGVALRMIIDLDTQHVLIPELYLKTDRQLHRKMTDMILREFQSQSTYQTCVVTLLNVVKRFLLQI